MKNLISMVDFVLEDNGIHDVVKYANFLKQPLELWMFVPCDENGNVLEEKKPFQDKYYEWKQAKERCLFEGFTWKKAGQLNGTIEDLVKYNLQLTPTALKQIGL